MANTDHHHSQGGQSSAVGVLEKVADMGAALRGGPVRTWKTAREGTQQLASVMPETMGLGTVKHFIQRHPAASACAALALGYMVFGASLPIVAGVSRILRGRF